MVPGVGAVGAEPYDCIGTWVNEGGGEFAAELRAAGATYCLGLHAKMPVVYNIGING